MGPRRSCAVLATTPHSEQALADGSFWTVPSVKMPRLSRAQPRSRGTNSLPSQPGEAADTLLHRKKRVSGPVRVRGGCGGARAAPPLRCSGSAAHTQAAPRCCRVQVRQAAGPEGRLPGRGYQTKRTLLTSESHFIEHIFKTSTS